MNDTTRLLDLLDEAAQVFVKMQGAAGTLASRAANDGNAEGARIIRQLGQLAKAGEHAADENARRARAALSAAGMPTGR